MDARTKAAQRRALPPRLRALNGTPERYRTRLLLHQPSPAGATHRRTLVRAGQDIIMGRLLGEADRVATSRFVPPHGDQASTRSPSSNDGGFPARAPPHPNAAARGDRPGVPGCPGFDRAGLTRRSTGRPARRPRQAEAPRVAQRGRSRRDTCGPRQPPRTRRGSPTGQACWPSTGRPRRSTGRRALRDYTGPARAPRGAATAARRSRYRLAPLDPPAWGQRAARSGRSRRGRGLPPWRPDHRRYRSGGLPRTLRPGPPALSGTRPRRRRSRPSGRSCCRSAQTPAPGRPRPPCALRA